MTMTPEPPPEHGPLPSLPADRTFVVQFSASPDNPADGVDRGRVEHLVSGLATRFHPGRAARLRRADTAAGRTRWRRSVDVTTTLTLDSNRQLPTIAPRWRPITVGDVSAVLTHARPRCSR